jgi:crooked neck
MLEFFGEDAMTEQMLVAFAHFEERQKEFERARVIYQYGLGIIKKIFFKLFFNRSHFKRKKWWTFQSFDCPWKKIWWKNKNWKCYFIKKEASIWRGLFYFLLKNFFFIFKQIKENSLHYDVWFDYTRLLINESQERADIEDCFERAIANVPPYMVFFY